MLFVRGAHGAAHLRSVYWWLNEVVLGLTDLCSLSQSEGGYSCIERGAMGGICFFQCDPLQQGWDMLV